jgi:signal transduction histidine kinase
VPVIIVTALDDRVSRLKGIEVGADGFISKPFDRVELQTQVQTITRLNRYRRLYMERLKRQQAEEEIRQRNQELMLLKEAERIKDQFVSNVSHELRTPLSVIALLSGNLDTLYERLPDAQRKKMIRDIRRHTQLLDELIVDVLEMSQIDSGQISLERSRVNLVTLVREEIDEQRSLAQRKSQTLQIAGCETLMIWANERQMGQVIRNLLNNAIKYTATGGCIRWECAVECAAEARQNITLKDQDRQVRQWAVLRVCDNGIGISLEHIPHLFKRFYRAEAEGNISGTGLGLSIAHELVEQHAGQIAVHSTPGKGSVFMVYLPLLDEA